MRKGCTLQKMIEIADLVPQVRREEIHPGDRMAVFTRNSCYWLEHIGGNQFLVSGGWFDQHNQRPARVSVRGCTWGGSAIKVDVLAARGLCLEFSNNLVTSAIRKVVIFPVHALN